MFRKLDITPEGKRFSGQLVFVAVGATRMEDVHYELPSGVKLPFDAIPRIGEKVTIYYDGSEDLVCGIVKSVEWSIGFQELGYSVFVLIEPLPTEPAEDLPAKIYSDAELVRWGEDFCAIMRYQLGARMGSAVINPLVRRIRDFVCRKNAYAGLAFMVGEQQLPSFDEWVRALLDGKISQEVLLYRHFGPTLTKRLLTGLREWKRGDNMRPA